MNIYDRTFKLIGTFTSFSIFTKFIVIVFFVSIPLFVFCIYLQASHAVVDVYTAMSQVFVT